MAISSATSRVDYTGDGATTAFAFPHYFFTDSDLLVTTRNNSTGVETTQVLTTNYTVTGEGSAAGGVVTFLSAPATGHKITIRRVRNLTQTTDIRNQGDFYPETHEDALDHLTFLSQQLQDQISRSIRLPETEAGTAAKCILSAVENRASKYLYFDSNGEIALASVVTLAPYDAQYVTLATNGTLTSERVLTGTANQITITDGGAGSTVTLSTPQNIHTGASPTFAGLTVTGLFDGRIVFPDGSDALTGSSGLYWDRATSRLYVGSSGTPARKVEIEDGSAAQLRLSHLAATDYTDFAVTGTGGLTITPSSALTPYVYCEKSAAGVELLLAVSNTSLAAGSSGVLLASVGGVASGDPFTRYSVAGGFAWSVGIDNSDSDAFVVSGATSPGTGNALRISTSNGVTLYGHTIFGTDNTYDIGAAGATRPRTIYPGTSVVFPTGGLLSWSTDLHLQRDAADVLAQRNGVNAQELRVYNTYTDSSNYERLRILWSANECYIQTIAAGTGAARPLNVGTNGNAGVSFLTNNIARYYINGTGHLLASTDNAYDIGASGATRPRTGYFGTNVFAASGFGSRRAAVDAGVDFHGGTGGTVSGYIRLEAAGAVSRETNIYSASGGGLKIDNNSNAWPIEFNGSEVRLWPGTTSGWTVNTSKHLIASVDNTYDIGASLATRPRTGYFGTSIIVGPAEGTTISGQIYAFAAGAAAMVVRDTSGDAEMFVYAVGATGGIVGTSTSHALILRTNNANRLTISADGTAWTIATATSITLPDACNLVVNATTGTKIGTATTQKIGLWNATPVVQPSSTGETTGWTTGGGSAATSTDTYTGNSGTKAYTVNDIVKHLKAVGILAGS